LILPSDIPEAVHDLVTFTAFMVTVESSATSVMDWKSLFVILSRCLAVLIDAIGADRVKSLV